MSKLKDLIGQKFNRWTVMERSGKTKLGEATWLCRCECGNFRIVPGSDLRKGKSKSCGCLQRERMQEIKTTHGKSQTRLYRIWTAIRQRCMNPNTVKAHNYMKRGIKICKEWDQFENFYTWAMEAGYSDRLSIDRIDVNGDYTPQNCRWASAETQANNKTINHYLTYNGKTQSMMMWSKEMGIPYSTLRGRINAYHWSVERALTTYTRKKGATC